MKFSYKKLFKSKLTFSFLLIFFTLFYNFVSAQDTSGIKYKLSSGEQSLNEAGGVNVASNCDKGFFCITAGETANFLQSTFNLAIGISITIAVVLLILAGVNGVLKNFGMDQTKVGPKYNSDWWNPIVGLIIIFCSVIIVRTLNPDLLEFALFNKLNLSPAASQGGKAASAATAE